MTSLKVAIYKRIYRGISKISKGENGEKGELKYKGGTFVIKCCFPRQPGYCSKEKVSNSRGNESLEIKEKGRYLAIGRFFIVLKSFSSIIISIFW